MPGSSTFVVDQPIQRRKGNIKLLEVGHENGKAATTVFTPMLVGPTSPGGHGADPNIVSVMLAQPRTGRTHQIRVHAQYARLPLVGDSQYGVPWHGCQLQRQGLHAACLSFWHPITDQRITIQAPLPRDMLAAMSSISVQKAFQDTTCSTLESEVRALHDKDSLSHA